MRVYLARESTVALPNKNAIFVIGLEALSEIEEDL